MPKITETIFRDAHQSLAATRVETSDMIPILEKIDQVGYWSLEMWGGATFDTCLRFLYENPWQRIREFKKYIKKELGDPYPYEIEDYYGGLIATVYYDDGDTQAELHYYWDDEENEWVVDEI